MGLFKEILTRDGFAARYHRIDPESVRHEADSTHFDVLSYAVEDQAIGGYWLERTPEVLAGHITQLPELYAGLRALPRYAGAGDVEASPEAAALLAAAGWKPHPKWGVYTRGTLVMGGDLQGGFHVKDWGLDIHGPDTPDTAEEAAAWLVHRFAPVASAPEPEQIPAHETHGETGEAEGREESAEPMAPEDDSGAIDLFHPVSGGSGMGEAEGDDASDILDADYLETNQLDDYSLGAEIDDAESEASGAFIFGDNLDQKRTAAIGLVVQAAIVRMPAPIDYAVLSELRNFTLGVSEGRWPDDPAQRAELDVLEARERRRRAIETARDDKTAFLVSATREQIEAFDPESDWPA